MKNEKVTSSQEKHPLERVFWNADLAMIPLLYNFVAENNEKLSSIKSLYLACLNLAIEFSILFKHLPYKELRGFEIHLLKTEWCTLFSLVGKKTQVDYQESQTFHKLDFIKKNE